MERVGWKIKLKKPKAQAFDILSAKLEICSFPESNLFELLCMSWNDSINNEESSMETPFSAYKYMKTSSPKGNDRSMLLHLRSFFKNFVCAYHTFALIKVTTFAHSFHVTFAHISSQLFLGLFKPYSVNS